MVKIIRLSRYKFDKNIIQHNVTFQVTSILNNIQEVINERIKIMATLIECVFPNTIVVTALNQSPRLRTEDELAFRNFNLFNRMPSVNIGEEISFDKLKDLILYCYIEGLELELDIFDIKNQHVTACINNGDKGYHYLYGTPETFTKEYIDAVKKKLPDCPIAGSFKKTL